MWQTKLCLGLNPQFKISFDKQIRYLKQIGFEAFFFEWNESIDTKALKSLADELEMEIQSIHAPYVNSRFLWENGKKAKTAIDELLNCVQICTKYDIPIMVCHAFIGFEDHSPTETGVKNFGIIVDEAEKLGVKIAFENTEGEEYLACLMEAFKDRECVGFCWDTGHEMCYNHSQDMMALYGDRIMCTHLNDNLGIRDYNGVTTFHDDLHLLPFDGVADWDDIVKRLNKYSFDGILTFELNTVSKWGRKENDCYTKMEIDEYLTEAYKRACRVATIKAMGKLLCK